MRLSHSIELYIAFHASATAFEMSFNADTFKVALVLWHFSKTLSVVWDVLREIFITSMDRLNASQYPVSKHCPTVSAMAPAMVSLATLINLVRALTTSRVAGKLLQVQFSETRKHCSSVKTSHSQGYLEYNALLYCRYLKHAYLPWHLRTLCTKQSTKKFPKMSFGVRGVCSFYPFQLWFCLPPRLFLQEGCKFTRLDVLYAYTHLFIHIFSDQQNICKISKYWVQALDCRMSSIFVAVTATTN